MLFHNWKTDASIDYLCEKAQTLLSVQFDYGGHNISFENCVADTLSVKLNGEVSFGTWLGWC